jgi:hypothetical protein
MRRVRPASAREVERLLTGMELDGVPLGREAVIDAVEHPHWETTRHGRDWRAYVPRSMREEWGELPLAARLCVFETAELAALEEDAGASMITG